jgi:uncharacterized CHY-type Zn-finger protein
MVGGTALDDGLAIPGLRRRSQCTLGVVMTEPSADPSVDRSDAGVTRPVVRGVGLDAQSRCAHYNGPTDIVAIRFMCCGEYSACKDCQAALAGHAIEVWPRAEWAALAILCGACGAGLTILAYLGGDARCRACGAGFNPLCRRHHHFYFDVPREAAAPAAGLRRR